MPNSGIISHYKSNNHSGYYRPILLSLHITSKPRMILHNGFDSALYKKIEAKSPLSKEHSAARDLQKGSMRIEYTLVLG